MALLAPTAAAAVALGAISTLALDPVASALYQAYQARANALRDSGAARTAGDIWLRQGDGAQQTVIHADIADPRSAPWRTRPSWCLTCCRTARLNFRAGSSPARRAS